jgi:hypothetical protein
MMDMSWFCLVLPILLIIPIIIWGTVSRFQYAKKIFNAKANGAFDDMSSPEMKRRKGRLLYLQLIGILGFSISFVTILLRIPRQSAGLVVIMVIFGLMSAVASFFLQRDINRRL